MSRHSALAFFRLVGAIFVLTSGCGSPSAGGYVSAEAADQRTAAPGGEMEAAPVAAPASSDALYAQAAPAPAAAEGGSAGAQPAPQATDARASDAPLLIYTAQLHLSVHRVEEKQDAAVEAIRSLGGFMSRRTNRELVLRVPSDHFHEAVEAVEALGEVLHRAIEALDVGAEYRDLRIRIQNLSAMRDRLEELLARAENIEHALQVERQLERVTVELERLKGRLRQIADQIMYSTITLRFEPRPREEIDETFDLPFPFLDRLGIGRLMRL